MSDAAPVWLEFRAFTEENIHIARASIPYYQLKSVTFPQLSG